MKTIDLYKPGAQVASWRCHRTTSS